MLAASKLKSALLAGVVGLCAVGLTAGLARGFGGGGDEPAAPVIAKEVKPERPNRELQARGVVVDEEGRPIAGAEVRLGAYSIHESRGVTDADGAFAIPAPEGRLDFSAILVRADDGRKVGFFRYDSDLTRQQAAAPVRVVAGPPAQVVAVRVVDGAGAPIADAAVEAAARFTVLAHATTGADGVARLAIPRGLGVNWIVARKDGAGYDYAEFGDYDSLGISDPKIEARDLPESVSLTLEAPRVFRVRALEPNGSPAAGVPFFARVRKRGGRSIIFSVSRIQAVTTDAEGVATFDWLPTAPEDLRIYSLSDRYGTRSFRPLHGQTETTEKLVRLESIRGRVRLPDGSPAAETRVAADGRDFLDRATFSHSTRAEDDGSYELKVHPSASYAVSVASADWRAPARFGVVVYSDKPVEGLDFQFERGTILRGRVTVGPDDQPAPGQRVQVAPLGKLRGDSTDDVYRPLAQSVFTDEEGRYEFRLARGDYALLGPNQGRRENVTIEDAEKVRDIRLDRLEMGYLRGVVIAGPKGEPVPRASVSLETMNPGLVGFADEHGRFEMRRPPGRVKARADGADGSLGGVVEVGADETDITIRLNPTATATGVLLGPDGEIAADEEIPWGFVVESEDGRFRTFRDDGPGIVTDEQGRFTLRGLILGERREIGMIRNNKFLKAGEVQPDKPGRIDLGTLRAEPLEAGRAFP